VNYESKPNAIDVAGLCAVCARNVALPSIAKLWPCWVGYYMLPTNIRGDAVEADLEDWARMQIANAGGWMCKWVIPSVKGPPDNIVFWPQGRSAAPIVHFLEFKNGVDGKVEKLQHEFHKRLAYFGHTVKVPRDKVWISAYIDRYAPKPLQPAKLP